MTSSTIPPLRSFPALRVHGAQRHAFDDSVIQESAIALVYNGIAFAVMLMLMQLGFRDALVESATLLHERLDGEVVLTHPLYEYLLVTRSFPEARLSQSLG